MDLVCLKYDCMHLMTLLYFYEELGMTLDVLHMICEPPTHPILYPWLECAPVDANMFLPGLGGRG